MASQPVGYHSVGLGLVELWSTNENETPPGPPPFQHCKTLFPTLNWRTLAPRSNLPHLNHRAGMIEAGAPCLVAADKDTYLFIFPNWVGLSLVGESNKFTTYHQPHSGAKAKVALSKRRCHVALRGGSAGRNVAESTSTRAQPHNGSLPEKSPRLRLRLRSGAGKIRVSGSR